MMRGMERTPAHALISRIRIMLLVLAVAAAFVPVLTTGVSAETVKTVNIDGFSVTIYGDDPSSASVYINGYTGSDTALVLPTHVIYNGKKYQVIAVNSQAFKDNTKLTSVIIPKGYEFIGKEAFYGCTGLTEVTLGDSAGIYFETGGGDVSNAFAACPYLKTYRLGKQTPDGTIGSELGIGKDASGKIIPEVTVYLVQGSGFDTYLKNENNKSTAGGGNAVTLSYSADPAAKADLTKVIPASGGTAKPTTKPAAKPTTKPAASGPAGKTDPAKQLGNDGTAFGKGASSAALDKAITSLKNDKDPKGTVFNGLQAKITKVKKTSLKLTWKKVGGAKVYVVYGNKCGTSNKYKKLQATAGTSLTFKKVAGKKVKKGTYYKFIVVALDSKSRVISTSKTVHAATTGGKVGNDKKVKTAAKKNKVSVKKGKTFKLKAKAVPKSKKLKVNRHRKMAYESTNPKVAKVSSKGVIKGVKKGSCYVYAYTQNGVCAKIKVKVK